MNKESLLIKFYKAELDTEIIIPFFDGTIRAGFPSPATDYLVEGIDLNKELIKNPTSTFYGIVKGDSMRDEKIFEGDLVIIDRALKPLRTRKILCRLDNEFTIKFVEFDKQDNDVIWLVSANPVYPKIKVTTESKFEVWGIVTYTITPHVRRFRD